MTLDETLIPDTDVTAALDAAIAILAQTSQTHADEIGRYVYKSFKPNAELAPIGVAIMFHQGCSDFEGMMSVAVYPGVLATMMCNLILSELRKLPGVDAVFTEFENRE
jgi:hypothetical protein